MSDDDGFVASLGEVSFGEDEVETKLSAPKKPSRPNKPTTVLSSDSSLPKRPPTVNHSYRQIHDDDEMDADESEVIPKPTNKEAPKKSSAPIDDNTDDFFQEDEEEAQEPWVSAKPAKLGSASPQKEQPRSQEVRIIFKMCY